ncbi:hypothetical protein [Nocardioides nanhaiensis]|uniref:MarR family transcriptional regulator n=1 Tax=Nocardioides nanhaiensis TaxID=1476871 RepID=A0ABP8W3Z6_9ACTN
MTDRTTLPVRRTDPDTSHEAAAQAVTRRERIRDAVLATLRDLGPMTHDDLAARIPWASPSGVRTRTSELVTDGLVEAVPNHSGKSGMGNRARLWRAAIV